MFDALVITPPIALPLEADIPLLASMLERSAALHSHLCPRQVLGVRIGLAGARALRMDIPRKDKRMLVVIETDGCFTSGVAVATGCRVRHRTMRVEDYGKVAATFVRVSTGEAVRVAPQAGVRERARAYAPEERRRYFAMLAGYQKMPEGELLKIQAVRLRTEVVDLVSRAGVRVNCQRCGEEVINEREVQTEGAVLCRGCAYPAYYFFPSL